MAGSHPGPPPSPAPSYLLPFGAEHRALLAAVAGGDYSTVIRASSPPFPDCLLKGRSDGGVDILAGTGPMGFGSPRLCVQVKSSSSPADVNVLRGLQGFLQNFHADQGLLVCWGGFKSVIQEARQSFFTIRLWDSGDLLGMILKDHDRFPDELKAELPLKRIWALVLEE